MLGRRGQPLHHPQSRLELVLLESQSTQFGLQLPFPIARAIRTACSKGLPRHVAVGAQRDAVVSMGHSPVLTDTHERYPAEPKTRAVPMYHEAQPHHTGAWPAMFAVTELVGASTPDTHPVDTSMNTLEHSLC